jgi:hypothetical protein
VIASLEGKGAHVGFVEATCRILGSGDAEEVWIEVQAIDFETAGHEEPCVLAGATADIEYRTTVWVMETEKFGNAIGFFAVVLEAGVNDVVELR